MIVFDLEWNRGYDKTPLEEILQIGAVRLDRLGGRILDTFNAYIRPQVHKKFDRGAKSLPELAASRDSQLTFPEALDAFRRWCADETAFGVWGNDDLGVLDQNCRFWALPPLSPGTVYNLQSAFSHACGGTGQPVALWRAVRYCRIPETFEFHSALYDALYTALVGAWLKPEDLAFTPPPQVPRWRAGFSQVPFPPQPKRRVGPLASREAVLNSKQARRQPCPLCGQDLWVQQWRSTDALRCYGLVRCPEHGGFLCRLTLSARGDGTWSGRLALPALSDELLRSYEAARRTGSLHLCRRKPRRSRRRRRRSRRKMAEAS